MRNSEKLPSGDHRPRTPTIPGYEILKNSVAAAFKARQEKANRLVALKMILSGRSDHPRYRAGQISKEEHQ